MKAAEQYRLRKLNRELSLEGAAKILGVGIAFTNFLYGRKRRRFWLFAPFASLPFFFLNRIMKKERVNKYLRKFGLRTKAEIEAEKFQILGSRKNPL